jgi:diacylglycerol kinase
MDDSIWALGTAISLTSDQQQRQMHKRLKSFAHAFNGLGVLLKEEPNARIHFVVAICVIVAGFLFQISRVEWLVLVLLIGLVIALEIFNSVVERIADFVSPQRHDSIKKIKDLAAAGVLVAAITSAIVGLIIFLPKVFGLLVEFRN